MYGFVIVSVGADCGFCNVFEGSGNRQTVMEPAIGDLHKKHALFRRARTAQNLPLKAQQTLLSALGMGALANGCYYGVGMAALEDECSGKWMSLCHYVVRVAALWQTYALRPLRFGHTCSGKRT